jgi:glycosyltransferase involved in cell wall biosynthesis
LSTGSRILVVAPVPTHPSATGASARVRAMAEALSSLQHEVHFLHLQQTLRSDATAMRAFWGERLHPFRSLSPMSFVGRARRRLVRIVGKTFHLNLPVDSYFDPEAAAYLQNMLETAHFDVVILSYVFYSRLLDFVPAGIRKLIDTHDVFSDRFRLYRAHGQTNEFFSTSRAEEAKALDRADVVLAIQESDANHFQSLTTRPVAVVGHLASVTAGAAGVAVDPAPAMLFVGGPMGINVHGVEWFIQRVLPAVRRRIPEAELWLAGGIGDQIREGPGVRRLGFVDALDEVYRRAGVVINPQQFGTGLSIKSIEALRHARPLVSTVSGARGLEDGAGLAFRQAASAEEFGEHLVELLRNPAEAAALAGRRLAFARAYHERNLGVLADLVHTARPNGAGQPGAASR